MARVKVRHALASWFEDNDNKLAFRGEVVDIPEGPRLDQLRAENAVVDEDAELDRPGEMVPITSAPSDEELFNWLAAATSDEITQLVADRPDLAGRILEAYEGVQRAYETQREMLSGKVDELIAAGATAPEPDSAMLADVEPPAQVDPTIPPSADTQTSVVADDMDQIVQGTVTEVAEYLSRNPAMAQAVREAEERRVSGSNEEPRQGVMRAVDIAQKHA